jgi:hypothetical protein
VILPVLNTPRANVHNIIFVASARNTMTVWPAGLFARARSPARPPNATASKIHAGAATPNYTPEKLLLSSLLSLAGAINNFFLVYPQKYKNCSTLVKRPVPQTPNVRHSTDCTCCDFGHLQFSCYRFVGPPDGYKYDSINLYQHVLYGGVEQYTHVDSSPLYINGSR